MDNRVSEDIWFPEPFWKADFYEMTYLNRYIYIHSHTGEALEQRIARERQKQFWKKTYGIDIFPWSNYGT